MSSSMESERKRLAWENLNKAFVIALGLMMIGNFYIDWSLEEIKCKQ